MHIRQAVFIILTVCAAIGSAQSTRLFDQRNNPTGSIKSMSQSLNQAILQNMPVRFQWFNNGGYCGETSLLSAGLKYGQYVSQYKIRQTVGGSGPGSQTNTQVLVGDNDGTAAEALHLNYVRLTSPAGQTNQFLTWVKAYILNDKPVIIGIYTNQCLFYGARGCFCGGSQSVCGDPEYDHIVPVLSIQSNDLTLPSIPPPPYPTYYSNDIITFSDNGLEGPENNPTNSPCRPNPANPYQFEYTFDGFQNDRKQANNPEGQWYSLGDTVANYAIAILGVNDTNSDTIPVTVTTNVGDQSHCPTNGYLNYEFPEIVDGSDTYPGSLPLSLQVTVTISDQTQSYYLYYYNDLTKIPDLHFNAQAADAYQKWSIPANQGPTFQVSVEITSDQVAAFRAVPQSAS